MQVVVGRTQNPQGTRCGLHPGCPKDQRRVRGNWNGQRTREAVSMGCGPETSRRDWSWNRTTSLRPQEEAHRFLEALFPRPRGEMRQIHEACGWTVTATNTEQPDILPPQGPSCCPLRIHHGTLLRLPATDGAQGCRVRPIPCRPGLLCFPRIGC